MYMKAQSEMLFIYQNNFIIWGVCNCWQGGNKYQFEDRPKNNETNVQNLQTPPFPND